ncbi:diguanylate cyclase [Undibacterium sp. CY7W]|uniref:diguanylate cyclase n=1 Tax=Undibacterium rugosum TaxID=2762291 RepID=A0A923ICW2_9BURK|nr:diguanylate cyclase [Undibacterium rugosum]MBR7780401.1 diguanylate cyclase [Undibacterium rugosum]
MARLGSEEFVLFMPKTNLLDATHIAERVRRTIDSSEYTSRGLSIHITISLGLVQSFKDSTHAELFELADIA